MNTPSAHKRVLDARGTGVTERDKLSCSSCWHSEGEGWFCSLPHRTPGCLVNYFPNRKYDSGFGRWWGRGQGAAEGASGVMPGQDGTFSKGSGRCGVRKRAWATVSRSCHRCKSGCPLSGALVGGGRCVTLERLMKPGLLRDLSRHFFRESTVRKCLSQTRSWPMGPSQGSNGSSSAALWVELSGHRRVTGMTSQPEAAGRRQALSHAAAA